ncbi:spore germination protein (amino acid permease) [Anaerobranca californiensis DSM 14826]|jgi:spore germination protein (amino acid permease)|uniref:Spore germination protein (Amino acid permease) n=1 Tax=Anaerobranca californiensis DSM 14826 TaxID=1120989 RepID=A0A1M6Q3X5_9FIRM|nr:endospore germination permease [Anaerobranca californiensis]SHK14964.1 spore germination protein (amino acid permease) [Anaerobranca californiensis DSM 14826]
MLRSKKNTYITDFQWISLLFCVMVGVGVTTLPRELADGAGRDGWLTIIISTLLVLLYGKVCLYYAKMFPDKTLAQSVSLVLGKLLGAVIIILYAFYTLLLSGLIIRSYLELIYVYLDIQYPYYFSGFLPFFIIVYVARCGLSTLARFTELIFMMTIPFTFLIISPIFRGNIMELLPVFEGEVVNIFTSIPLVSFAFLGLESILIFYPYLQRKKDSFRTTFLAINIVALFYTLIFITSLLVLGIEQVKIFNWPFMAVLRTMRVAIIERIDTIFLIFWIVQVVMGSTILYFAGTFSLAAYFHNRYHDIWGLICWPVAYFAIVYPKNILHLEEIIGFIVKISTIFLILLPIILIIIAKIRGVGNEK